MAKAIRRKNPADNKIFSKSLVNGGTTTERLVEIKATRPLTAASQIAGDKYFKVNWYHPELRRCFPGNSKLWHVDKFYPYAKDEPLFVDEPRFDYEILRSKQKAEVLEKIGVRFLILKNGTEPLNEIEGL
jgi:hypothetical protein